jgi:hypothetical protein
MLRGRKIVAIQYVEWPLGWSTHPLFGYVLLPQFFGDVKPGEVSSGHMDRNQIRTERLLNWSMRNKSKRTALAEWALHITGLRERLRIKQAEFVRIPIVHGAS